MTGKYKAEYEFYPAEDKYEGDCHRYTGSDHNGLSDSDLSSIELRQNPYQREKYSATFVFSTHSGKRDMRKEAVLGLLEGNAGVTDAKVNSHGNASGFSVEIDNLSQKDLMRLTLALTQEAPKGPRGDAVHYPVLGADVAGQVIGAELGRLNMTPVQAGLVSITTDEMSQDRARMFGLARPVSYVDVSLAGYPTSPVEAIRENGEFSELAGAAAMQVHTRLELRGGQAPRVMQAMQDAGLRTARIRDSQDLRVEAPADSVAEALGKAGMLPVAVVDAIRSAAEAAHPGQQKINAQIEEEKPAVLSHRTSPAVSKPAM